MTINVKATGMDLTDAIKQYAEDKIEGLVKFFDNIQQADVAVGLDSSHHKKGKVYYAEVNIHVPGKVVRVRKDSEDLYKAIDKVKDHMKILLDEMKDKMRKKDKKELREVKAYHVDDEE